MIAERMKPVMEKNSAVRAMFEEGNKLKQQYGADKVFDFSLGNPNAPAPEQINVAIKELIEKESASALHGYMNNAGFDSTRQTIAEDLNKRFDTNFSKDNILMVVGAASGINVAFKTLLNPGEEVIAFSPYFLEYNWYAKNHGGEIVSAATCDGTFMPDLEDFEKKITDKTRAVIINSPNNPTGVIYDEETIKSIAKILNKKQKEYNRAIFIISDEPYRELAYDGAHVPYLTKYYDNTIVGYSYSKSLSLPGERIGYLVIPNEVEDSKLVFDTATAANRIMGFVNAPSLIQKVIEKCLIAGAAVDLEYYNKNRNKLYEGLTSLGFDCTKPQGAFYMFMKSPMEDEKEFCQIAKKYNILMVPGSSFGKSGYVRIAYCVSYETIENSMEAFKKLAKETL